MLRRVSVRTAAAALVLAFAAVARAVPRDATPLGPCADTTPVDGLVLTFSPRDPDGLAARLARPRSGWLTPQAFGERFGLEPGAYDAAAAWLEATGFTDVRRWPNRLALSFAGTAGTVTTGLAAPLDAFVWRGELHHAPTRRPSLPSFAGVAPLGVAGLDSFAHVRPLLDVGGRTVLAPADVARVYGVDQAWAAGFVGTGIDIAVVASSDFALDDVARFRSATGLPPATVQKRFVSTNPGSNADAVEAALDVQWAGAVARDARVIAVIGGGSRGNAVFEAINEAVNGNVAPVISISFGVCEAMANTNDANFFAATFEQAAAQGQTVLVASGDDGASDCGDATFGPSVNLLAAAPSVVGVGGTRLDPLFDATGDATGYGGEVVWNDDSGASGGGPSRFFPKPSWQTGEGVPDDGARGVPDVAAAASSRDPGYFVVSGAQAYAVGGTSAATPVWAGMVALVLQARGNRIGLLGPDLYRVGAEQAANGAAKPFHDVVSGTNSVPGVDGYSAGPGWDFATGWGSFDAPSLLSRLAGSTGAPCGSAADCDDGDPCTADTCLGTSCVHGPSRGDGAVACVLGSSTDPATLCPGEQVPKRIASRIARAARLLARTDPARTRRSAQLVRASQRLLKQARRMAVHARSLSTGCSDTLAGALDAAVTRATRLLPGS